MAKIFLILIIASIVESIGIAFLSAGLKEINQHDSGFTPSQIAGIIKAGACNGKILLGITLEAAFFGALLYMLSVRDVSLIWPLTSMGFIVTTLAAQFLLHEKVGPVRWAGVLLIAAGAFLTSYSESSKKADLPASATANSTTLRPQ
jgi:drug/metabolite transporter (DMT)-like permease